MTFAELADADELKEKTKTEILKDDSGNTIGEIVYDSFDRIISFTVYPDVGGSTTIETTYNSSGDIESETVKTYDEDGKLIATKNLTVIATEDTETTENIAAETSILQSPILNLQLDMMSMGSNPQGSENYTEEFMLDLLGNRLQLSGQYGYDDTYYHNNINQYTRIHTDYNVLGLTNDANYSYDDKGNLESDDYTVFGYEYDWRNRLTKVTYNMDTVAEFAYDALGRRISKTVDGETTYYYYDTMGRVIAEYTGAAESNSVSLARTFVYGNGIDEVLAMFNPESETPDPNSGLSLAAFCEDWLSSSATYDYDSSGTVDFEDFAVFASNWTGTLYSPSVEPETRWYYLHDALGSVMAVIGGRYNRDADREFYLYDVYGKPQGSETSLSGNPYGFASYRYDPEIGLYYLRARYYDPDLGRFTSLDPLGIVPNAERPNVFYALYEYKDGMNLYEYAKSEPITNVDPYGLEPYCCKIKTTRTRFVPCPTCGPGYPFMPVTETTCTQNTIYSDCKTPELACCAAYGDQKNVSVYEAKGDTCKWCTVSLRLRQLRGWKKYATLGGIEHATITMKCDDNTYQQYISRYPFEKSPDAGDWIDDEESLKNEFGKVFTSCATSKENAQQVYNRLVTSAKSWIGSGTCIGFAASAYGKLCGCP
jgi:RHS repeat-associated protein